MSKRWIYLFVFLLNIISRFQAQEYEDDAAIWLSVGVQKSITEKTKLYIEHKCRINNNISTYYLSYLKGGVSYSLFGFLKTELDYAYGKQHELDGYYSTKHRFNFSVIAKKEIRRFTLSFRNRTQTRLTYKDISERNIIQHSHNRNKLAIKYDLNKRINPYMSYELYLPLYQTQIKGFDRSRSEIGFVYNVTSHSQFEFYYMLQQELNAYNKTHRDFIYGISYQYKF